MNKFALDYRFDHVPFRIIREACRTLRAYKETHVRFENGEYTQSPHIGIKSRYAPDFKMVGTIKQTDIYTPTEIIENYINEFQSYPIEYKGIRDYTAIKVMQDNTTYNEKHTICTRPYGKINSDGNFILQTLETIDIA